MNMVVSKALCTFGLVPLCAAVLVIGILAPAANAAPAFELVDSFSEPGSDPGQLSDPQRAAVDIATGNLVVADRGNDRVELFDSDGDFLTSFGDGTVTDDPLGVAVDQAGRVYVSSQTSQTVTRWTSNGLPVPTYTRDLTFDGPAPGTAAGEVLNFGAPLAVDPTTGDLLVGDPSIPRIQRFSSSGDYLSTIDGAAAPGTTPDGAFTSLEDIATDAAGRLYVVDGSRTVRFGADESYEATLDAVPGPALVAVDPTTGDPVVAVDDNDRFGVERLIAYDGTTPETETFVPPGTGDYTFPFGLAFNSTGRLFVVTTGAFSNCCGGTTAVDVFDKTGSSATVGLGSVTGISESTATLSGTVDPEGATTTYWFETSADGGASYSATLDKGPLGGSSAVPVTHALTGLSEGTEYRYRLAAKRGSIVIRSAPQTFDTTDVEPPALALEAVSDLTDSGATLNGTIDSNGSPTTYHFEYSPDGGSEWLWLPGPDGDPGTDDELGSLLDSPVSRSDGLVGLTPDTTYPIRIVATNAGGSSTADGTFDTPPGPPVIGDLSVSEITATTAKLSALVDPRNAQTTYHFEYGPSGSEASTPQLVLPVGTEPVEVSATVSGLEPSTDYQFRVVADNGTGGPQERSEPAFTTLPPPPLVTIDSVSGIGTAAATVSGTVDPQGQDGFCWFSIRQVGGGFMTTTSIVALDASDGLRDIVASLPVLPAGIQLEARMVAATAGGQRSTAPLAFSTPAEAAIPAPSGGSGVVPTAPRPRPRPRRPSNRFSFVRSVKGAKVTLTVAVPGKGAVMVRGDKVRSVTGRSAGQGVVVLEVRLIKSARRALRRSKSGRLRTPLDVTYAPPGGIRRRVTQSVTFKR